MGTALPPEFRIGSEIAGYRIESLISRGGMGIVFLATELRLGRRVALKLLSVDLAANPDFRRRFVRESQLAASIDHPNIVPVYGAGDVEGQLWIAMRYVEGVHLRGYLDERGPLALREVVTVVDQVGRALDAAHRRQLVHRDVKPTNILILLDEDRREIEHAYLSDFGLTKRLTESSGITDAGHFVGTVNYVAPEQILGKEVDGRADIYSLGCVAHECLSGRAPFAKAEDVATLYAHLNDPIPSLVAIRPDLPVRLDRVIARAMAKSPTDRFPTCADLVAAIREAAGGGGPSEVGVPSWRPIPAAPGADVTLAASIPAPRPASPGALREEEPSPPQPADTGLEPPGRPRRRLWVGRPALIALGVFVIGAAAAAAYVGLWRTSGPPTGPGASPGFQLTPGSEIDLTNNAADDEGPEWSPDGTRIAFASDRRGNWDVYVMDADGGGQTRLTSEPGTDNAPTWSPDGDRIAFISNRQGSPDIWVMNADGSNARRLVPNPGQDRAPAWSPDGRRIGFVNQTSSDTDVLVVGADGTGILPLVPDKGRETEVVWSPDGSTVAFVRIVGGRRQIFTAEAEGGGDRRISDGSGDDHSPSWSPAGKIAFVRSTLGGSGHIYVANADGTGQRRVTTTPAYQSGLAWSRDGTRLAFTTNREGDREIYLVILSPS